MANIARLNYTADEINEKLGEIDALSEFDTQLINELSEESGNILRNHKVFITSAKVNETNNNLNNLPINTIFTYYGIGTSVANVPDSIQWFSVITFSGYNSAIPFQMLIATMTGEIYTRAYINVN